jgi:hypothetical protein
VDPFFKSRARARAKQSLSGMPIRAYLVVTAIDLIKFLSLVNIRIKLSKPINFPSSSLESVNPSLKDCRKGYAKKTTIPITQGIRNVYAAISSFNAVFVTPFFFTVSLLA